MKRHDMPTASSCATKSQLKSSRFYNAVIRADRKHADKVRDAQKYDRAMKNRT